MMDVRNKAVAEAIWNEVSCLSSDYSDVTFAHIITRPRYQHLKETLERVAENAIEAADRFGGER